MVEGSGWMHECVLTAKSVGLLLRMPVNIDIGVMIAFSVILSAGNAVCGGMRNILCTLLR